MTAARTPTQAPDRALRVAHVVPAYYPMRGGIEVLLEGLIPVLRDDFHIDSTVIVPLRSAEREPQAVVRGVSVTSIPMADVPAGDVRVREVSRVFAATRRALAGADPDVVHLHSYSQLASPAAIVARAMSLPVVVHIHGDLDPDFPPHFLKVIREADRAVAVSASVAESMIRLADRAADIRIVRNGVADPGAATQEPDPRMVMVGRLEPEKGFADGVRALAHLAADLPNLRLDIVGGGRDLIPLQLLSDRLRVADRVHFHGEVDHGEVLRLLAMSSVTLVPSVKYEGCSLVAVESALLGRPVVAYDTGGLAETVVDGSTGTVVPCGDWPALAEAARTYLCDPAVAHARGRQARQRAMEDFSMTRFAREIADVYGSLDLDPRARKDDSDDGRG